MFVLETPYIHTRLDIDHFKTVEEKLKAVIDYLKISTIYCQVENKWNMKFPYPLDTKLHVKYILVPGGQVSYLRSILDEWLIKITSDLNDFIYEDIKHRTIGVLLQKFKILCKDELKANDTTNRLKFNDVNFMVMTEANWRIIPEYHLHLSQNALSEINEHFELRKAFFKELIEHLDSLIELHEMPTDLKQNPYVWDSENATYEIAQLLYAIQQKRLKLNPMMNTSLSKFRKDFYELFAETDKGHHQKLQDIRKKSKHGSYLHEFAKCADEIAVPGKDDNPKWKP